MAKRRENPLILNYREAMKKLKDEMLQNILSDNNLTKVEKLETLAENNVLPIGNWIQHPFYKYEKEFKEMIWANPAFDKEYARFERDGKKYNPIIDDYFCFNDYWDRHQTIDLAQVARDVDEDDIEEITVLTNRSTKDKFKISKKQFIDDIYDFCISNNMIGFVMDW